MKIFTPILLVGQGPVCDKIEDVVEEIILYFNVENAKEEMSQSELKSAVSNMIKLLKLENLNDGIYQIMTDYKIIINHMSDKDYNEMPEFAGY